MFSRVDSPPGDVFMRPCLSALLLCSLLPIVAESGGPEAYDVGVAQIDITPTYPVRLSGFGFRRTESDGVTQRIWAKALAIGTDEQDPAILITVDNLGVPADLVWEVGQRLEKKTKVSR